MNFFGHAVVATWYSPGHAPDDSPDDAPDDSYGPELALGAMLPDFASMCRGRLVGAEHAQVAEGIALHHRTDRVFHTLDAFTQLERETTERVRSRGVGRGGALATGHVGVELLLDGLLLDDERACALYLAALRCEQASAGPERSTIEWKQPAHAQQWASLRQRMISHGLPHGYRDPDVVASRLAMILRGRPSLALSPWEQEQVRKQLPYVQHRVASMLDTIMNGLRSGLRAGMSPDKTNTTDTASERS